MEEVEVTHIVELSINPLNFNNIYRLIFIKISIIYGINNIKIFDFKSGKDFISTDIKLII